MWTHNIIPSLRIEWLCVSVYMCIVSVCVYVVYMRDYLFNEKKHIILTFLSEY